MPPFYKNTLSGALGGVLASAIIGLVLYLGGVIEDIIGPLTRLKDTEKKVSTLIDKFDKIKLIGKSDYNAKPILVKEYDKGDTTYKIEETIDIDNKSLIIATAFVSATIYSNGKSQRSLDISIAGPKGEMSNNMTFLGSDISRDDTVISTSVIIVTDKNYKLVAKAELRRNRLNKMRMDWAVIPLSLFMETPKEGQSIIQ